MKCSECGHANPSDNLYCGRCGKKLLTTESVRTPGWLLPNPPEGSESTVRCPGCWDLINADREYCPSCGTEIGIIDETEAASEKYLKLPRWLWLYRKAEVLVRPHSEERFIEYRLRVFGAEQRTINSKTHYIAGGIVWTSIFLALTVLCLWLSIDSGAWWIGVLLEIAFCLTFLPGVVIFFWALIPPK